MGGRKAGTPNKLTKEKREMISQFLDGHWEEFEQSFREIDDPVRKCQIMIE